MSGQVTVLPLLDLANALAAIASATRTHMQSTMSTSEVSSVRSVMCGTEPLPISAKDSPPSSADYSPDYHVDGEGDQSAEYDWEAERSKHAREKGVQRRPPFMARRYREMVWERRDGCWRGRWRWPPWEKRGIPDTYSDDRRERILRSWDTANAPQEVLLHVATGAVRSSLANIEEAVKRGSVRFDSHPLYNMALVCKAWYKVVAPALYSRLRVSNTLTGEAFRHSTMKLARALHGVGGWPCQTLASLARQYRCLWSNVLLLEYQGPEVRHDYEPPICSYHPSQAMIKSQCHHSFRSVVSLRLLRCRFLSSVDLLRLLASLPSLVQAHLQQTSVSTVSRIPFTWPGHRASRLQKISAHNPPLPFLVHCLTGVHNFPAIQVPPFLGLSATERLHVAGMTELIGSWGSSDYSIHAMDNSGETCTFCTLFSDGPRCY